MSELTLYGLSPKTCDTMKKACLYLTEHKIPFTLYDYRQENLSLSLIEKWLLHLSYLELLNKRSTTWRQLDNSIKENLNEQNIKNLFLQYPTLIKRPLFCCNEQYLVGFHAKKLQDFLNNCK